jgi:hypothetical protein
MHLEGVARVGFGALKVVAVHAHHGEQALTRGASTERTEGLEEAECFACPLLCAVIVH